MVLSDDVLIHGQDQESHDRCIRKVLKCLQAAGLTLNDKCELTTRTVKFLGHIVGDKGVHPDPDKVEAIKKFPTPKNTTELQRFMGMVNHLAKYIPKVADINAPLRALLCKDNVWVWDHSQQSAFEKVKEMLTSTPILAHYDPRKTTIIAADASNHGIGAVLLQIQEDGIRKPACYISRSLNVAEKNYAVIEKEALATTWACERFSDYVFDLDFTVETDHKPLVPLLNTTELHKMPPRILRFRLRLTQYNLKVIHVQGKNQIIADTLSRAPVNSLNSADIELLCETTAIAKQSIDILPAATMRLQEISEAQKADDVVQQVREYTKYGRPVYMPQNPLLKQYWTNQQHLTIIDDLLLFDSGLVIPRSLKLDIMNRLHEGHLGITKCHALASSSVW